MWLLKGKESACKGEGEKVFVSFFLIRMCTVV